MIQLGTHIEFDDEDGNTLSGTVFHFLPCLTNGRKHAVVEIDSPLPGITHTVPLDSLRPTAHSQNFVFVSSNPVSLSSSQPNRRFFILP